MWEEAEERREGEEAKKGEAKKEKEEAQLTKTKEEIIVHFPPKTKTWRCGVGQALYEHHIMNTVHRLNIMNTI